MRSRVLSLMSLPSSEVSARLLSHILKSFAIIRAETNANIITPHDIAIFKPFVLLELVSVEVESETKYNTLSTCTQIKLTSQTD